MGDALSLPPYYRPLFTTLFTLNYAIFGNAAGAGLVNVLIHAAVTLLVFIVTKEITARAMLAATTAALFAVHPAYVRVGRLDFWCN